jgi:uncharacterized protein
MNRVRATWRVLLPLLVALLVFSISVASLVATGLPMGTVLLASWLVTTLVTVGTVLFGARYLAQRSVSEYGYRITRGWWLDFVAGVGFGSLIVVLAFLIAYQARTVTLLDSGLTIDSVSLLWLGAFLIGFIAVALWEELVFRGVFMTNAIEGVGSRGYSRSIAVAAALLGSSAVFALVHIPGSVSEGHSAVLTALWTLSGGVLFGVAYLLTGELALPMGLLLGLNYVSGNILGIAGVAQLDGVPVVLSVDATTSGLMAPMDGLPIVISIIVGISFVIGWCYWQQDGLTFNLGTSREETDSSQSTLS